MVAKGLQGKLGKPAYLENWNSTDTDVAAGESIFSVNFDYEHEIGKPGALLIKNNHHSEFYLKTVTLEHVPGHGRVHFVCNSWVYPDKKYEKDRVFFTNKVIKCFSNSMVFKQSLSYAFLLTKCLMFLSIDISAT